MRKRIKNLTITIIFLVLVWLILTNSKTINENVLFSFDLWLKKVFPSLFPMFVISDILINYGLAEYIGAKFSKISQKLFNVSGTSGYVFILALLSGTPSNAIYVKELYDKNYLTNKEASKILAFTFFANPIFLYNFLNIILKNYILVIKIILICYLSNIIIGIIFRNLYKEECSINIIKTNNQKNFTNIFTSSIKKAMNNLIMILGTITFFIILSSIIDLVAELEPFSHTILKGILELTQGLDGLININTSLKIKAILATAFISFGGLSIHMQIKSIINDTDISYKLFFWARILQAFIAVVLLMLLF